jgi:hypothetical protein
MDGATDPSRQAASALTAKEARNKSLLVIPAKAGIQCLGGVAETLTPSFRWDGDLFKQSPHVVIFLAAFTRQVVR